MAVCVSYMDVHSHQKCTKASRVKRIERPTLINWP